jgi:hypothetical protein
MEKKDEKAKTFDEVKNAVAETLWKDKSKKAFVDERVKTWEAALAQGKPLDAELKKNKIELKKTGSFSLGHTASFIPSKAWYPIMKIILKRNPENPCLPRIPSHA